MVKQKVFDANNYRGEWVAFDPDTEEVVAHDPTFAKAHADAKKRGVDKPLTHGVPESEGYFVGGGMITGS